MGVASIVWCVFLTIVCTDILDDSIAALGLMIAFFYAFMGRLSLAYMLVMLLQRHAAPAYFRRNAETAPPELAL